MFNFFNNDFNENVCDFFSLSSYKMIDVSCKNETYRRSIATGLIYANYEIFELIKNNRLIKGDPFLLAEISGIEGAKNTFSNISLCHYINITGVSIRIDFNTFNFSIRVYCIVSAFSKTGVEMEAITGVSHALISIYDLLKTVNSDLFITDLKLLFKEGGKNSVWTRNKKVIKNKSIKYNSVIITSSDRANNGYYYDKSGILLYKFLFNFNFKIIDYKVLPDSFLNMISYIKNSVKFYSPNIIFINGGTGFSKNDFTSKVLTDICDVSFDVIGDLLRFYGLKSNKFSFLSRCSAGLYKNTFLISFPGNPNAVKESIVNLNAIIPHILNMVN